MSATGMSVQPFEQLHDVMYLYHTYIATNYLQLSNNRFITRLSSNIMCEIEQKS